MKNSGPNQNGHNKRLVILSVGIISGAYCICEKFSLFSVNTVLKVDSLVYFLVKGIINRISTKV